MAKKKQIAATLDEDVLTYLERLAAQEERSRSQLINRIIKDHAAKNGAPLSPRFMDNHGVKASA